MNTVMESKNVVEQVAMQQLLNNPTVKRKTPADEIGTPGCHIVIGNRFARAGYRLSKTAETYKLYLIELFQYLVDCSEEGEYSVDFSRLSEERTIETIWGTLKVMSATAGDVNGCPDHVKADIPVAFLMRCSVTDCLCKAVRKHLDELSSCRVTFKDGLVLDGFIRPDYSFSKDSLRGRRGEENRVLLAVPVEMLRAVFDFCEGYSRFGLRGILSFNTYRIRRLYPIACSLKEGETVQLNRDDLEFLFSERIGKTFDSVRFFPRCYFGEELAIPQITAKGDNLIITMPSSDGRPDKPVVHSCVDIVVGGNFTRAWYSVSPFAEDCKVYLLGLFQYLVNATMSGGGWSRDSLYACGLDIRTEWGSVHAASPEKSCGDEDGCGGIDIDVPLQYFVRGRGDCREWYFRVLAALGELSVCEMKMRGNERVKFVSVLQADEPSSEWCYDGKGMYIHLYVPMHTIDTVFDFRGGYRRFKEDDVPLLNTYEAKRLYQMLYDGYSVVSGMLMGMLGELYAYSSLDEFVADILNPAIHKINKLTGRPWEYTVRKDEAGNDCFVFARSRKR